MRARSKTGAPEGAKRADDAAGAAGAKGAGRLRLALAIAAVCLVCACVALACSAGGGASGQQGASSSVAPVSSVASDATAPVDGASSEAQAGELSSSTSGAGAAASAVAPAADAQEPSGSKADGAADGQGPGKSYVAGQVLVQLDGGLTREEIEDYLRSCDFVQTSEVSDEDLELGFLQLQLAEGVQVEEAVALLEEDGVLGAAQPNFIYHTQADGIADAPEAAPAGAAAHIDASAPRGLAARATAQSSHSAFPLTQAGPLETQDASDYVNDPEVYRQWALDAMNVPEAWETLLAQGAIFGEPKAAGAVGVAVIDEGFNVNHEDLQGVVVAQRNVGNIDHSADAACLVNAYDASGDADVSEVYGQKGHGTHVAGIVAAQVGNGLGVAGVSYNAKLVLVKAYDESVYAYRDAAGSTILEEDYGIETATLAAAFDYVLDVAETYNVRVISTSLGAYLSEEAQTGEDKLVFSKIDAAYKRGIVTVCSAGNSSTHEVPYYNYPSDYPLAVSVISSDSANRRYSGSNYNDASANEGAGELAKDLAAPGVSIYSTYFHGTSKDRNIARLPEENNAYYGNNTGTSMAAPQVAGVLALVFAANPQLSASEAVSALCSSAVDLNASANLNGYTSFDYETGYGLANARDAVASARSGGYLLGTPSVQVGATAQLVPGVGEEASVSVSAASADDAGDADDAGNVAPAASTGGTASLAGESASASPADADAGADAAGVAASLGATVSSQEDASAGAWVWHSSNAAVAAVTQEGQVAGVSAGSAVVTATRGTQRLSATVDVFDPVITVGGVQARSTTLERGSKATLAVEAGMAGSWTWASSDSSVAAVKGQTGALSAKAKGSATVTATLATNPDVSVSLRVNVTDASWSGASSLPVGATAAYSVENGSMKVLSGTARVKLKGSTLVGLKAGKAKLGLYDNAGKKVATKTVSVYKLTGKWALRSAAKRSLALAVKGSSKADGARIVSQRYKASKTNERFRFVAATSTTYALKSVRSGKLVRVVGKLSSNGAAICQKGTAVTKAARWKLRVDALNCVTLVNVRSGKALSFRAASAKTGNPMVQKAVANKKTQKWVLEKVS